MLSLEQQAEVSLLETELRSITERFDQALNKDMVLGDVKKLFHELKALTKRLDLLREERLENHAKSASDGLH